MKRIEIIVAPDGSSKVETKGFVGGECREASKFIEEAIGARVEEKLTGGFYQTAKQQNSIEEQS